MHQACSPHRIRHLGSLALIIGCCPCIQYKFFLRTHVYTEKMLRKQLEEEMGMDLSEKKLVIRAEVGCRSSSKQTSVLPWEKTVDLSDMLSCSVSSECSELVATPYRAERMVLKVNSTFIVASVCIGVMLRCFTFAISSCGRWLHYIHGMLLLNQNDVHN